MRFTLIRDESSEQGTFGELSGETLSLQSAELPWHDNAAQSSCIPSGVYNCIPYSSAKFSDVYMLEAVPGRSAILIHSGNFAGDVSRGYRSDVQGCILLGMTRTVMEGQKAVGASRDALNLFRLTVGQNNFSLEIIDYTRAAK